MLRTELEKHSVNDEEENYNDYDWLPERPKMTMMMRRWWRKIGRRRGKRKRKGKKRRGRKGEEKGGRERGEETRHSRKRITPM